MTCTGYKNRCACSTCCDRSNAEDAAKMARYSTELTHIGEQFLIPGCEQRRDRTGSAPRQPSLWDKQ